jgi:hypothetical protein
VKKVCCYTSLLHHIRISTLVTPSYRDGDHLLLIALLIYQAHLDDLSNDDRRIIITEIVEMNKFKTFFSTLQFFFMTSMAVAPKRSIAAPAVIWNPVSYFFSWTCHGPTRQFDHRSNRKYRGISTDFSIDYSSVIDLLLRDLTGDANVASASKSWLTLGNTSLTGLLLVDGDWSVFWIICSGQFDHGRSLLKQQLHDSRQLLGSRCEYLRQYRWVQDVPLTLEYNYVIVDIVATSKGLRTTWGYTCPYVANREVFASYRS